MILTREERASTVHRAFLLPKYLRESCQPDDPLSSIALMCVFYKDIPTIRRTCPQCSVKIRKLVLTHYYHLIVRLHPSLFPYFPLQEKKRGGDPFQNQVVPLAFIFYCPLTAATPILLSLSLSNLQSSYFVDCLLTSFCVRLPYDQLICFD